MFVRKNILSFFLLFLSLINRLSAQNSYPAGDYWSLDAGAGTSDILVNGLSFQAIIDPKLWLSPALVVGSKTGINYTVENADSNYSNILTFEGQVYLRWNFLRLGKNPEKLFNIFLQGGLGLISSYRGREHPFDDKKLTRGSLMADAALGVTIPLTAKWHLEPQIRGGYPHLFGAALTFGYKFPLRKKTEFSTRTEYVSIIRTLPPKEIIKQFTISAVEYVLFGPDTGSYNLGIDSDARQINELVIDQTAKLLKENPNFVVRIEGHANPVTLSLSEADELMVLGSLRSNAVAEQLEARGVSEDQIIVISFGGTRTVTSEWDIRNRNRRVELIIIQLDLNQQ